MVLALTGFALVSLFGNITVTNQLNYTSMKAAVESAMYDSINMGYYRSGFCFCPSGVVMENESHQKIYSNQNQYTIEEMVNDSCDAARKCEPRYGEYVIDAKIFAESLVRRFSELVNNNKNYKLIIQDVVEYPPKVSVKVDSDDTFVFENDGFTITNQIDAILEEKDISGKIPVVTEKPSTPTATPNVKPKVTQKPTSTPKASVGNDGSQCHGDNKNKFNNYTCD